MENTVWRGSHCHVPFGVIAFIRLWNALSSIIAYRLVVMDFGTCIIIVFSMGLLYALILYAASMLQISCMQFALKT
jgi:hypothetical protein